MKILVTGGAGFIGSQITDKYILLGHQVTIVDNLSTGKKEYINPKAEFIEMDIQDKGIEDIFKTHTFDILNHHAAQIDLRKSVDDPKFDVSVNVIGSINLLENAVRYSVKKVIFASTGGAIYGEHEYFPADEKHPTKPFAPYGINKLSIEKYLFYYNQVYALDYIVLRYANVYGPRQNSHGECGVIAIFTDKILNGTNPLINGDGKQTRDYAYVDDVVQANLLMLDSAKPDIYNVGTSIETSVNEIFREVNNLAGTNFSEQHGPAKKGEQRRSVLSYEKIKQDFGWQPEVDIKEGLKRTVGYFRNKK